MATEPSDNTSVRLAVIGVICVSLFASLFARLYYLQVIDHQTYQVESRAVHLRTKHEQAPRGRILDRNGNVLVDNRISVVVGIDKEVSRARRGCGNGDVNDTRKIRAHRKDVFQQLAILLTESGLPTKITNLERLYTDVRYGPNDFLPIVDEGVSEQLKAYLAEHHEEFPGVVAKARTVRVYPYGSLAAHLLGYVGQIIPAELASDEVTAEGTPSKPAGPDSKPYAADDQIGKSGVERSFERYLRGKPGDTVIQVDARGQRIGTVEQPDLQQGDDVWLTIDINLQALAERQLAAEIAARHPGENCDKNTKCNARDGSTVIVDPRNGEVLAMASFPTFDPSLLVNGISTDLWERLNSKETNKPMLNRAMAEAYAPGSTFKLVSTHAALTKGVITPEEVYVDRGGYHLEGCSGGKCDFYNAGRERLGSVNLQRALTVSSDTYYYRLGDLLWRGRDQYGDAAIQDSAKLFGFGQQTGIDLPSESPGLIGTPSWLADVYAKNPSLWDHGDWKVGDSLNVAIGQGLVAVTPLQLANAYATFANGGTRYVPQIALRVTRPKSLSKEAVDLTNVKLVKVFEPEVAGRVDFADPNQYSTVFRGLQGVTSAGSGTASKAFDENPTSWPLAGKTGTAQVSRKADTSVFVGFGPATGFEPPRYAMAAVIPEGGFGADAGAPLVFKVMKQVSENTVAVVSPAAPQQAETGPTVEVAPAPPPPTTLPLAPTTTPGFRRRWEMITANPAASRVRGHDMTAAWRHVDVVLCLLVASTVFVGSLMVYSVTRNKEASIPYIEKHVIFVTVGVAMMIALAAIDYVKLRDWARLLYLAGIASLVGVLTPLGSEHKGIRAWYDIGPFQIQPAEVTKVLVIIAVASYLGTQIERLGAKHLVVSLLMFGLPMGLIMLQPDLGTTLVFVMIAAGMLAVAGIPLRYLVALAVIGIIGVVGILQSDTLAGYQRDRLTSFADPDAAESGAVYNTKQSQTAISLGGLTGQGYLDGEYTKGGSVPEQETDFIFTVPGEELGFLGSSVLLLLLGGIVWRVWRTAQLARDQVGRLICVGVLCLFVFHIFENVGMNLGIMPVTGIPLPFVSYGGSATISAFACMGLVLNVHMRRFS